MNLLKEFYKKFVWCIYVFYLFSIVAFGDRIEYYMISNIIFMALIVVMSLQILSTNNFRLPIHLLIFLPFVIYSFVSCLWSQRPSETFTRSITLLELVVLQILLAWYLERTKETVNYIYGIAVAGILIAIYVISTYGIVRLKNMVADDMRVGGEIVNENTLAIFFALAAVILFFFYIETRKNIYLPLALGLVVLNVITGSKKGLMDLAIGIFLTLFFASINDTGKKMRLLKWTFTILGVIIAIYFAWKLPVFDVVKERFELMFGFLSGKSSIIDYSTRERKRMIEEGMQQFYKTPILGIGIGATSSLTMQFLGRATYLHNNYVELLASGGLIGTALYYIALIKIAKNNLSNCIQSFPNQCSLIIIIIMIINDMAAVQYFSKLTFILFAIALAASSNRTEKMENHYEKLTIN